MSNYNEALSTIKESIDSNHEYYPKHQGTTDITEVIDFPTIAEDHNLTQKEYEKLIDEVDTYYKTHYE